MQAFKWVASIFLALAAASSWLPPFDVEALREQYGGGLRWAAGLWFFALLFVLAPYNVWKQERERAVRAENQRKLLLKFEPEEYVLGGRAAWLRVKNLGADTVEGCKVALIAIEQEGAPRRPINPESKRIPLWWDTGDLEKNIDPLDDASLVVVAPAEIGGALLVGGVQHVPRDSASIITLRFAAKGHPAVERRFRFTTNEDKGIIDWEWGEVD